MPEIKTELVDELPKPTEGQIYTIMSVEVFTSPVRSYKGIRVAMTDRDNKAIGETLWTREVAGEKSKLGSFLKALGKETDAWIGKHIKFVAWSQGNRKIEVV